MKYFKKRTIIFVMALALTIINAYAVDYSNHTATDIPAQKYTTSKIEDSSQITNSARQSVDEKENITQNFNSIEDEFASLREEENNIEQPYEKDIDNQPFYDNETPEQSSSIEQENIVFNSNTNNEENSQESLLLILSVLLIIFCSIFFFVKAKNRLTEVVGETLVIEVEEDDNKNKKNNKRKNLKKIKDAVNTLDKAYSKTAVRSNYTQPNITEQPTSIKPQNKNKIETVEILDLDKLYSNNLTPKDIKIKDENKALEDFLSGFSYYEENDEILDIPTYNEEFYQKIMSDDSLRFQKQDFERIYKLLRLEITDETMNNIDNFLVSNPIEISREQAKEKILEDLFSNYIINKNIAFTDDDMIAIQKIMNVELDKTFVTDLRTNPGLTKRMIKEMEEFNKENKKPGKIKTLNVKDFLPDLSEALLKQAGKRIESNYKPETVYYQTGYDVATVSVSNELPVLSDLINNYQESQKQQVNNYNLLDDNYEIDILETKNTLPDLNKELHNPKNFEKPAVETIVPNEKNLIKNLNNVKFKDIDEKRNFEIINKDISNENKKNVTKNLSEKIAEIKTKRDLVENKKLNQEIKKIGEVEEVTISEEKKCIIDNKTYTIKHAITLKDNIGCYLTKNNEGYHLLSYVGDNVTKLKHFDTLKIEKLQARLADTLEDGTLRFIVRVGLNKKVLLDVKPDSVRFVMDL